MRKFPACFPDNFEDVILPQEAKNESKHVYRVIKRGIINREAFVSSYEEELLGLKPKSKNLKMDDPSTYSTSCFWKYEDAEYYLEIFMRHYPRPCIAEGTTEPSCGPCQLTADREKHKTDSSHVDWWIYQDSSPQNSFKEAMKTNE